jgi:hypothetical protein
MPCSQSAAQQETVIGMISWQLQAQSKAGLVPVNEDFRIFVPRGNL